MAASLAAAAAFAIGTVLQFLSARAVPEVTGVGLSQIGAFLRATLANPLYLIGTAVDVVGLALHALALHLGALAVVQPLMVAGVLFTLPLYLKVSGQRLAAVTLAWAVALAVGLAGFIIVATAPGGAVRPSGEQVGQVDREPAIIAGVLAVVVGLGCVALARRGSAQDAAAGRSRGGSTTSAALLGLAAGIAFAGTAALLKSSTGVLVDHPVGLLSAPSFYALLVVGSCGLVLHQLALAAGPLTASLPAFTVIDPLVSIALGVTVYDERLRATPTALVWQALSLTLMVTGAAVLTRAEAGASTVIAGAAPGPAKAQ